ncbi:hypothetical protein P7K49_020407 [Saguinus oedipus]|uniref:Uncharacterized protein n=1 Tax=Saguinus oedipus TaxID=9490 RepID=A0ABQ9V0A9_SAGOE|nr:hypothetical protein P7K49_020407 [Saguinus oedipus]
MARDYDHLFKLLIIGDSARALPGAARGGLGAAGGRGGAGPHGAGGRGCPAGLRAAPRGGWGAGRRGRARRVQSPRLPLLHV